MLERSLKGLLLVFIIASCNKSQNSLSGEVQVVQTGNLLEGLTTQNLAGFEWLNRPATFTTKNNMLAVVAEKGTDFFNNPEDSTITSTAPFLYQEVDGDFVAKALVRPDFSSMWNAAAVMVHIDSMNWIKFAFENSDATGKSIVSVVTKEVSDDANGVILQEQDEVWLKIIRKGDSYSMLWSLDDQVYKMARLTAMPTVNFLKVGVEVQCPVGSPATHNILYFGLEKKTVKDLRKGE